MRARFQLSEQKTLTETSQDVTRSANACLSLARVAFKLCTVVKWSGYVPQGTGVQVLTVEQECLLLEVDVKHYEVQNLFSLLNAYSNFKKKDLKQYCRKHFYYINTRIYVVSFFVCFSKILFWEGFPNLHPPEREMHPPGTYAISFSFWL